MLGPWVVAIETDLTVCAEYDRCMALGLAKLVVFSTNVPRSNRKVYTKAGHN
jgi:hypothetical protein